MAQEKQDSAGTKAKRRPGRPPRVDENGQSAKTVALAAARKIIQQEGVSRLSFDRLAAVSGLAKGTLLYHFKKKENLLVALLEEHASELEFFYRQAQERSKDQDFDPVCAAFIEWGKGFYERTPEKSSFGLAIRLAFDSFDLKGHPVNVWFQQRFEEARHSKKNSRLEAMASLLTVQGLFYMSFLRMGAFSKEEALEILEYLQKKLENKEVDAQAK